MHHRFPTPPIRTVDQRKEALALANRIRTRRKEDKIAITERRMDPRTVLRRPPAHWENAKSAELLLAVPAVGHRKTERILKAAGVPAQLTLKTLSDDQRASIIREIDYLYT